MKAQAPNRFFNAIPRWFCVLAGIMLCGVLALLVVGQPWLGSYYANRSLLPNWALWLAALVVIAGLLALKARIATQPAGRGSSPWLLRAFFVLLLAAQCMVARSCWYTIGWDASNVHNTALELAQGIAVSSQDYFQLCPNNAPITLLAALPLWMGVKMGLAVPYVLLPYVDAVLLNLTAYVCVMCVRTLTQNRLSRTLATVLAVGWIALSPFILFPYTDTFSILFPVLALYLYLHVRKPVLKWFLISLVCFFGAAIKPTVLIVLIAMLLLGLCRFLGRGSQRQPAWRRAALVLVAVALGAAPGMIFQNASTAYLAGSANPDGQLSATHYLMLGMNGETFGGHSPDDVTFTESVERLEDAQRANLARAWERLSARTLAENLKFFSVKAFKAYNDGSFAAHSSFLALEIPKRTDALSIFLRQFYHARGAYNLLYHTIVQGVWLGVLTLCAYAAFARRKNATVAMLSLTLIGLTAYLLLFEVWPRYLFLYAPFYAILASMALDGQGVENNEKS